MGNELANIQGNDNGGIQLNIPTIDARYNDANLRVKHNYNEYLALSIAGFAVLGAFIYQTTKKQ
jgi:hypothetical protein